MINSKHYLVPRVSCPACGKDDFKTIYTCRYNSDPVDGFLHRFYEGRYDSDMLSADSFVVDQCNSCTLDFQRFVPGDELLTLLYESWLSDSKQPSSVLPPRALRTGRDAHEIMSISKALGKPINRLRVFDYGMGWGLWCRSAMSVGCDEVLGFDLAESRMQFARENHITTAPVEDIDDDSLDFINTDQLFEHLVDPLHVADVLMRKLRIGGILKISVPAAKDLARRLAIGNWNARKYTKDSLNPISPLEHVNCWNERAVQAMGERISLSLCNIKWSWQLAFLGHGAVPWANPKEAAKALVRPLHRRNCTYNLYVWLQRKK